MSFWMMSEIKRWNTHTHIISTLLIRHFFFSFDTLDLIVYNVWWFVCMMCILWVYSSLHRGSKILFKERVRILKQQLSPLKFHIFQIKKKQSTISNKIWSIDNNFVRAPPLLNQLLRKRNTQLDTCKPFVYVFAAQTRIEGGKT